MALVLDEFVDVGAGCCNPAFYDIYLVYIFNTTNDIENPNLILKTDPVFLGNCENSHMYISDSNKIMIKLPQCTRVVYIKAQSENSSGEPITIDFNLTIFGTTGSLCGDDLIVTPDENGEINLGDYLLVESYYLVFLSFII